MLSVTGYYNKPSQEGMYPPLRGDRRGGGHPGPALQHPRPRIVDISVETMARLSRIANIVGVKDATANLMRPTRERAAAARLAPALRGRRHRARLHGAWRPWLHLGHGQCRAQAVLGVPDRLHAGRFRARA
ncbi:MAG: dihydrodipicolinate synthase family protein [Rhizomicrobium sp.]